MGTHPIFESDFDCLTDLKMLALAVLLVSSIDIILTFVLKLLKSPSQAHKEILEIDQELKGLSETDDFVRGEVNEKTTGTCKRKFKERSCFHRVNFKNDLDSFKAEQASSVSIFPNNAYCYT